MIGESDRHPDCATFSRDGSRVAIGGCSTRYSGKNFLEIRRVGDGKSAVADQKTEWRAAAFYSAKIAPRTQRALKRDTNFFGIYATARRDTDLSCLKRRSYGDIYVLDTTSRCLYGP